MDKKTGNTGPITRKRSANAVRKRPAGQAQRRRSGARRNSGLQGLMLRISDLTATRRGRLGLLGGFAGLIALIAVIGLIVSGGETADRTAERAPAVSAPTEAAQRETEEDVPEALPTQNPASVVTAQSGTGETWRSGIYAPEPQAPGYLPVFREAKRTDKVVAITVDDCFQTGNLREIISLAEGVGGKLTLFPIGELLKRESLQEVIRYAYSIGFEIENHTWSHDGLYNLSAEELAAHIFDQDRAVDLVLGVDYQAHFLRPKGGDDRHDQRTHAYISQLGYYGIAHWSVSGSHDVGHSKSALEPGAVYLFHCTDKDLAKLREFIPYCAAEGYTLVTLNEMFGYAPNTAQPLSDDPATREVIQLEPYERTFRTLKATTYDHTAYEVQEALIAKGFLTGTPDGVYGKGTAKSAAAWQKSAGYKADGVLTSDQQRELLGIG